MKRYIEQLKRRSAPERRRFSMRASAVIVGIVFVAWMATLGTRLQDMSAASQDGANSARLVAAVADAGSVLSDQWGIVRASLSGEGAESTAAVPASPSNHAPQAILIPVPTTTDAN